MKQNDYFGLKQTSKLTNLKPVFLNPFLQQNPSPRAAFHISQNLKTGLIDNQATKSLEQTFLSLPNQHNETSSKISIKSPSISQSLTRTSKFFLALEMQFSQKGQQDCSQLMKDLQYQHQNKKNKMNSSFIFPSDTKSNSIFDSSLSQQQRLNKTQILNSNCLQNQNEIQYRFKKNRREENPLDVLRKDEQSNAQLSNLIKQSNIQLYPQLDDLDIKIKNQSSEHIKDGQLEKKLAKKHNFDMRKNKEIEQQGKGYKIYKQNQNQGKKIETQIDSGNNFDQNKQKQILYLSEVSDNLSSFADESTIKKNPQMEQCKQQIDERSFARQQIYSMILDGSLIQQYKDSSSEDEFSNDEQDDNHSEGQENNLGNMKKQNKTYLEFANKQSQQLYPKLAQSQLEMQKLPKVEQIEDKVQEEWESESEDESSVIDEQQSENEDDESEVQQDDEDDDDDGDDEAEDENEGRTQSLVELKSQLMGMYLWNRMSAQQIEKIKETIIMYYKSTVKFPSKPRNRILSLLENLVGEIEKLEKAQFKECEVKHKIQLNMFVEKQRCKRSTFKQHYQQELRKLGGEVIKYLEKNEEKRKEIVKIAKKYNNREYFHVKQRRIIFAEIQHFIKLIASSRKAIERAIKFSRQVESSSSDEPVHQASNVVSSPTANLIIPINATSSNRVNQRSQVTGQNNVQLGNSQPTQISIQTQNIVRPVVNDVRPHNNISVVNQAQFSFPVLREDLQTEASSNLLQSRISIPESNSQQNLIQNTIISYSLQELKSHEAGKYLLSILEKNKISNLQNIISQYNSSNYFHVGPRRSILYFIQEFANKMNRIENTLVFAPVAKSSAVDKLIKAGNELRQYFTTGKVQQVNGTARSYNSSNYFHVGPRYSIFGDVRKVIQVYSRTI